MYQGIANEQEVLIGKIIILVILAIIIGTAYLQLSYDSMDIQNRIALIFFILLSCFMAAEPFFGLSILSFHSPHPRFAS